MHGETLFQRSVELMFEKSDFCRLVIVNTRDIFPDTCSTWSLARIDTEARCSIKTLKNLDVSFNGAGRSLPYCWLANKVLICICWSKWSSVRCSLLPGSAEEALIYKSSTSFRIGGVESISYASLVRAWGEKRVGSSLCGQVTHCIFSTFREPELANAWSIRERPSLIDCHALNIFSSIKVTLNTSQLSGRSPDFTSQFDTGRLCRVAGVWRIDHCLNCTMNRIDRHVFPASEKLKIIRGPSSNDDIVESGSTCLRGHVSPESNQKGQIKILIYFIWEFKQIEFISVQKFTESTIVIGSYKGSGTKSTSEVPFGVILGIESSRVNYTAYPVFAINSRVRSSSLERFAG